MSAIANLFISHFAGSSYYEEGTDAVSDGIFIPRGTSPNCSDINDFRQIAMLNVEGKLFLSLVASRVYKYLVADNQFIDTKNQKGSIQAMSGCWEHTAMIWSALKDSRINRKSVAILWLDLANSYGCASQADLVRVETISSP